MRALHENPDIQDPDQLAKEIAQLAQILTESQKKYICMVVRRSHWVMGEQIRDQMRQGGFLEYQLSEKIQCILLEETAALDDNLEQALRAQALGFGKIEHQMNTSTNYNSLV